MRVNSKGKAMKHFMIKIGTVICIAALCLGALAACSNAASHIESSQQSNRSYMSKVNGIMEQLGDNLSSFVDAVSRGDLVNMRTQAENAYRSLDDLAKLEAPEGLEDVQKTYVDGTEKLRKALNDYIDLYTAAQSDSFDQSTYEESLASIQALYDEGVELLKKGDETAASK